MRAAIARSLAGKLRTLIFGEYNERLRTSQRGRPDHLQAMEARIPCFLLRGNRAAWRARGSGRSASDVDQRVRAGKSGSGRNGLDTTYGRKANAGVRGCP